MGMSAMLEDIIAQSPTMGALARVRYTHVDMIDFLLANPGISQNALAARYGYSPAWVSNIMASDAWQSQLAKRREEMVDPALALTIKERMNGLTLRSIEVVMAKLDQPGVSDNVALRALELGAKASGLGGNAPPAAPVTGVDRLAQIANRLIDLQSNIRKGVTLDGQAAEVLPAAEDAEGE